MNEIFPLMSLYSRDFSTRFGDDLHDLSLEFAEQIYLAKLTGKQIKQGLQAFRRRSGKAPYYVNPTEFVLLCQADAHALGLPEPEDAYRECLSHAAYPQDHSWSHDGVYVAGRETGFWDLIHQPQKQTRNRFLRQYEILLAKMADGEDFSDSLPKCLPSKKSTNIPTAKGRESIAEIREKIREAKIREGKK